MQSHQQIIRELVQRDFAISEIHGENPEVFTYQFVPPDINGLIACKVVFFEHATVFGVFGWKEPTDLVSMMLKNGIETHVTINSKTFILNKKA